MKQYKNKSLLLRNFSNMHRYIKVYSAVNRSIYERGKFMSGFNKIERQNTLLDNTSHMHQPVILISRIIRVQTLRCAATTQSFTR